MSSTLATSKVSRVQPMQWNEKCNEYDPPRLTSNVDMIKWNPAGMKIFLRFRSDTDGLVDLVVDRQVQWKLGETHTMRVRSSWSNWNQTNKRKPGWPRRAGWVIKKPGSYIRDENCESKMIHVMCDLKQRHRLKQYHGAQSRKRRAR